MSQPKLPLWESPDFIPRPLSPFAGDVDRVLRDILHSAMLDKAIMSHLSAQHTQHHATQSAPVPEGTVNVE